MVRTEFVRKNRTRNDKKIKSVYAGFIFLSFVLKRFFIIVYNIIIDNI